MLLFSVIVCLLWFVVIVICSSYCSGYLSVLCVIVLVSVRCPLFAVRCALLLLLVLIVVVWSCSSFLVLLVVFVLCFFNVVL